MAQHHEEQNPIPEGLRETMAERLKRSLRYADVSTQEMADHLEVHRNTISGWTAGRACPSRLALRVFAHKVGVPLEFLETGIWPAERISPRL